jgi:Asp-tRNA(Asn)/Glu-tRNA(Gln) amidotransferase A subunit family amidase
MLEKLMKERGAAAFERRPIQVEAWSGPTPATEEDLVFQPVHRLAALIQSRRISSVDLTRAYLTRMKRLNPTLLCAVTIMEAQGMEAAQQADNEIRAGRYRGPLHGIPWGIKDLFAVKGTPTTWGSGSFETQVIDVDSEVYVRLREAGAVLIAKLATGRFAQGDQWVRGQTKNPWNVSQGSSGSSAGPGSATAAGCVAFGIGTETQGSIVSPTSRNGLTALRPTFGRISRHGGMVLSWTMDKVGPMCRSAEDVAIVFNIIHGADEKDPSTVTAPFQWERNINFSGLRIGYVPPAQGRGGGGGGGRGRGAGRGGAAVADTAAARRAQEAAAASAARATEDFLDKLRGLGARIVEVGARPGGGSSGLGIESAAAFEFFADTLIKNAADSASRAGRFNSTASAVQYLQGQRRRLIIMQQMAVFMKDLDMYLVQGGDTGLTNQTGHPAAVFPYRMSDGENSQPVTTTIIGNLFADDKILSVAHAYQKATDWHLRRPKL